MLAAGSVERHVFDRLMLDRNIRSKFTTIELEDHIVYVVRLSRESPLYAGNPKNYAY